MIHRSLLNIGLNYIQPLEAGLAFLCPSFLVPPEKLLIYLRYQCIK